MTGSSERVHDTLEDSPPWRRLERWSGLALDATLVFIAFIAVVTLGLFVGSAARSAKVGYVFFAAGMSFLTVNLGIQALEAYRAPIRIRYDGTGIALEYRHERSPALRFAEIKGICLSQYASGWFLEIETFEGTKFIAGADKTEEYGRGLLEAFAGFLGSLGKVAEVWLQRGVYPTRRFFISSPSSYDR